MTAQRAWTDDDTGRMLRAPLPGDDKYSRGVLGIVTGSDLYPGAAVLGVEAAIRTGLGMVRYLGPHVPTQLVLQRRPEVVAAPGRVQAWLIGSGMDAAHRSGADADRLAAALESGQPLVIDAGALDLVADARGPVVITPHYRELARAVPALGLSAEEIAASPADAARHAADELGVAVLLKGNTTYVAAPGGEAYEVSTGTPWLATAGSGDVLGGVLGALVAGAADDVAHRGEAALAELAAAAAALHGLAGVRASRGGPIAALDVAEALPPVVAALLRGAPQSLG